MGSVTANFGSVTANDVATSQESSSGSSGPSIQVIAPGLSQTSWPSETELLIAPRSNKIMLTVQRPLMHAVFQDTFDQTHATMIFQNAFPTPFEMIGIITDNLIIAAEGNPRAENIYNCLVIDGNYTTEMSHLVSV